MLCPLLQGWQKRGTGGSLRIDFGRIEDAAGQQRGAALLLAHQDFQTLHHPCPGSVIFIQGLH